ncbi:MAG: CHASE4 domain-containing protein [Dehalococcoidales bacterium]|jgi:signal transduction histidine kinase
MSIVRRTVIMVILITLVLFSILYLLSNIIYIKGFNDLEKKTVRRDVGRVTDALMVRLNALATFCQDWASWDDTYYFARDHNQTYIERNLMDKTFLSADVSLLLFLDTAGNMIYGKAYDIVNEQAIPLPADLNELLSPAGLLQPLSPQAGLSGIILISGQPALIAARPILTSLDEGPSGGTLIAGRFLDAGVIGNLAKTTSLSITIFDLPEENQNPELQGIMASADYPGAVYIQTQEGNTIAGYTSVSDLNGNPAFIFKVTQPRDIHAQGINAVAYLHTYLLIASIVFCAVFILLVRKLILTRLTGLSKAVNAIGSKGDMSGRIAVGGKDELSQLAHNINGMLESLEKSETRRQSQRELIRHIIAHTPVGILATDESYNIILFNDALRVMFSMEVSSYIGKNVTDIPGLDMLAQEIKAFKESGVTSTTRQLHYVLKGSNRTIIAGFNRLQEEERYILFLTDISEERAKQESLYLTDRLAAIGEMAPGIAHEVNNPLTSVIGISEMVAMQDLPETIKEDMAIIKSESLRAAEIVKNLLSFARKNSSVKQPTAINKILQDVLRLRSFEHGANNITVSREFDPELPEIMADSSQIQQVFINIILNAEQAMAAAHGRGTLKIKTEKTDDLVRITFTDDGPGIEPRNLRRIFDPFFTTKEIGKGTGLGLSISYGIVTEHKGRIYATSEPGKGATFVIELPRGGDGQRET